MNAAQRLPGATTDRERTVGGAGDEPTTPSDRPAAALVAGVAVLVQSLALVLVVMLEGSAPSRGVRTLAIVVLGGLLAAGMTQASGGLQRLAAWVLLVVSSAASTAAAILVLTHIPADGQTARATAALLALLAGVTAVVADVVVLATGRRWWRRLLAIPIGAVLLAFVAYPVAVAVYATAQPPAELGTDSPADRDLEHDDVTLSTDDDVELSGWYLPTRNGAAVVLLHGASSTRTAVLRHAEALHDMGYGVLLFDARGHGRSQGRTMDLGWYGDLDVAAAVDHLQSLPEVDDDRIGVVGMSMGGEEALGAAAGDPRIRAVVAEGAENRTYEDRDDWLPSGIGGWLQRRIDQVTFALVDLTTPASPPIGLRDAAAVVAPRPILLIVGEGEDAAARSIRDGAPEHVEIWETGTAHIAGLADRGQDWRQRVESFLDRALAPCTPGAAGC
jgi:pimeloyl-ACP methyl ester carboxylesterase